MMCLMNDRRATSHSAQFWVRASDCTSPTFAAYIFMQGSSGATLIRITQHNAANYTWNAQYKEAAERISVYSQSSAFCLSSTQDVILQAVKSGQ